MDFERMENINGGFTSTQSYCGSLWMIRQNNTLSGDAWAGFVIGWDRGGCGSYSNEELYSFHPWP